MISMFRYYTLPIIVLLFGVLASYSLYMYERSQENIKFQNEFNLRSQAHTAGIVAALYMFKQRISSLKALLESQSLEILKDNKQKKAMIYASMDGEAPIRSIIWVSKTKAIHNLWKTDIPLFLQKEINIQHHIIMGRKSGFYHVSPQSIWIISSFPIVIKQDYQGLLIVAWDIGIEIEKTLAGLPVAGIDIQISSRIQGQYGILHRHQSRSRKNLEKIDDKRMFHFVEDVKLLQHTLTFAYQSAPVFLQLHQDDDSIALLLSSLCITFLTFLLSLLLYKRGRTIKNQVKQRTYELNQSNHRITMLVNSIAEGLYDMDLEGRCTFINQRALDMFAYSSEEDVLGKDAHKFFHHSHENGDRMSHHDCNIIGLIKAVEFIEYIECNDEVFWKSDGTCFPVSYRATAIKNNAGNTIGAVVTFMDISKQLAAAQEAENLRMKLEHGQRLESLGVLAGGIAHDFNNLLSVIMGNIDIARMTLDQQSASHQPLERVEKASQRAADLCQQMLAYAGKGKFVTQVLNFSEVTHDIGQLLDVSISKFVTIHYQLSNPIALIKADKSQLQQVVMNILTNANEAMDEHLGGDIFVSTGIQTLHYSDIQDAYGEWEDVDEGDFVYLKVKDNGCGMSEETQRKVFEPFYTTKFTGRGLGMSAILGIIRGHHGLLNLQSSVGQGTTITVYLPTIIPSSELDLSHASNLHLSSDIPSSHQEIFSMPLIRQENNSKAFILVVDDEPALREMTRLMLKTMGYDVCCAADGEEALRIYQQAYQQIDLVLLDMTMPNMNGEQCLEKLSEINPQASILLMSGYHENEFQYLGDFMSKPFNSKILENKISNILNRS